MPDPLPGERLAGSAPQSQSQSPVSAPPARSEPRAPRWQLWRSPPGQPAGAWPLLLLAAALAGLAYGRGMALPQVIEGVLAVLVLYRAVRRLAGPLVLAADATSAALSDGKLRWLLMAAPAERWRTRIGHVAAAGVVTVLVSLSWMTAVFVVPAHDRPYADGSRDDSLYEQVFGYNGLARPKDRRSARPATGAGEIRSGRPSCCGAAGRPARPRGQMGTGNGVHAADRAAEQVPHPARRRQLGPGGIGHPGQRARGAADRRLHGRRPAPSPATLRAEIRHGDVHLFLLPVRPASPDPRLRWIETHCQQLEVIDSQRPVQYAYYLC